MESKYAPTIYFLRQCALMKRRITLPFKLIHSRFWNSESYYPELPQKSKLRIFTELLLHILKYGSIEWHYFSYGFDIKDFRNQKEYLDDNWFLWQSHFINAILPQTDYTCILRDKKLFSDLLTTWGFHTPHTVCEVNNPTAGAEYLLSHEGAFFCKPIDGQCGGGIFKFVNGGGIF